MASEFSRADRVRIYLNSRHEKYIAVKELQDLATLADMPYIEFRDGLKILEKKKEIEVESTGFTRAKRVTGIIINKLAPVEKISEETAAKKQPAKTEPLKVPPLDIKETVVPVVKPDKIVSKPEQLNAGNLTHILQYRGIKYKIEKFKDEMATAGVADVEVNWQPNPLGDEALKLLDLVERAQEAINVLTRERDTYKVSADTANEALRRMQHPASQIVRRQESDKSNADSKGSV
jgi:hypothetical protein